MKTIQVRISSELAQQLRPYSQQLPQILELGLHQMQTQSNLEANSHRRRVQEALQAAGLSQSQPETASTTDLLSAAQRAELGRRFATDRPLSNLIIEERKDR